MFLFLNSSCLPCERLLAELRDAPAVDHDVPLIVVLDLPGGRAMADELPYRVLFQHDRSVSRRFKIVGTPHAFAIDATGTVIAGEITNTVAQLAHLALRAREGGETRTTETVQLVS